MLAIGLILNLVVRLLPMAVSVNLVPIYRAHTLPLVSMGGTSVLFTSVAFRYHHECKANISNPIQRGADTGH